MRVLITCNLIIVGPTWLCFRRRRWQLCRVAAPVAWVLTRAATLLGPRRGPGFPCLSTGKEWVLAPVLLVSLLLSLSLYLLLSFFLSFFVSWILVVWEQPRDSKVHVFTSAFMNTFLLTKDGG